MLEGRYRIEREIGECGMAVEDFLTGGSGFAPLFSADLILKSSGRRNVVLSRRYGIHTAREAHDWFLCMMRAHDESRRLD